MSKLESETKDTEKKMRGSMDLLLSAGKGHRGHGTREAGQRPSEHGAHQRGTLPEISDHQGQLPEGSLSRFPTLGQE